MTSFEAVLNRLTELISKFATNESQERILNRAIAVQAGRLHRRENHISFRLPLLVYAALRGDDRPALDLAAAMLLLYIGTDLLDDLADEDMAPEWASDERAEIQLIAIGLFATIPQLIIIHIEAEPAIALALQRAVLLASARMGHGQQSDIHSRTEDPERQVDLQAAWDRVEAKSGAAIGLLGEVGALLAGAPESAGGYAGFGQAMGCAYCLMRDCGNLLEGVGSTDLINGTLTYPLVLHLSGLRGADARHDFSTLLQDARDNSESRSEVLRRLSAAGTFQVTGLVIDSCRRRGAEALDRLQPLEPAASALRGFLEFRRSAAV